MSARASAFVAGMLTRYASRLDQRRFVFVAVALGRPAAACFFSSGFAGVPDPICLVSAFVKYLGKNILNTPRGVVI